MNELKGFSPILLYIFRTFSISIELLWKWKDGVH